MKAAKWLGRRLKAGTLLYSLAICLLVGMVLSSLVLLHGYKRIEFDQRLFRELAWDNLASGKNLVLYGEAPLLGSHEGNLFGTELDHYRVEVLPWGLYGLLRARGMHGPAEVGSCSLIGAKPAGVWAANLLVEERGRPLYLAGEAHLGGELWLPKAGLRAGMVGSTSYRGRALHHGRVTQQGKHLPGLSGPLLEALRPWLEAAAVMNAGASGTGWSESTVVGDWTGEPLVRRFEGGVVLLSQRVQGQVVLVAPWVHVTRNAMLDGAIVCARKIVVDSGWTGRAQFFAVDSLELGADCSLAYPSVAALVAPGSEGYLSIGRRSRVEGAVISEWLLPRPVDSDGGQTRVLLAEKSLVAGHVFVRENLDLRGRVAGHVLSGRMRVGSPGRVYDNYLLDGRIGPEGLSAEYAMPLWADDRVEYVEIQALEDLQP